MKCLSVNGFSSSKHFSTFTLENIVLLYFKFYIYKSDKLITLTISSVNVRPHKTSSLRLLFQIVE